MMVLTKSEGTILEQMLKARAREKLWVMSTATWDIQGFRVKGLGFRGCNEGLGERVQR